jgi:hypothetical protein
MRSKLDKIVPALNLTVPPDLLSFVMPITETFDPAGSAATVLLTRCTFFSNSALLS